MLFYLTLLGVLGDAVDEKSAFHLQDTKLGLPHGSAHKCRVLRVHGPEMRTVWSSYQVVLLVVHLRRVPPHAVDGQQQIHEGKRGVQPEQVRPATQQTPRLHLSTGRFTRFYSETSAGNGALTKQRRRYEISPRLQVGYRRASEAVGVVFWKKEKVT